MIVSIVTRPAVKAVVLKSAQNGRDVRTAWKEVQRIIQENSVERVNREVGIVFVPEWQWETGVKELWVGVEVASDVQVPDALELLTLPARTYATIRVYGDREQMDKTYSDLNDWFKESSYQRDYRLGSYSFEANRLNPTNPFDIPADEINHFDFEIYAPIVTIKE
ncbi:GyrI-like domain-containing protein [Paenibacillus thermotolerans]|uniref:GyrI-like domain-containing protein n=1 Tax=Paenibacillus thermotolerans TaxID=3027807 RepID=UPI002367B3EE|nr:MULTISPECIES: GyrI-like domain-containing protein [unclassified Paenibacillus]